MADHFLVHELATVQEERCVQTSITAFLPGGRLAGAGAGAADAPPPPPMRASTMPLLRASTAISSGNNNGAGATTTSSSSNPFLAPRRAPLSAVQAVVSDAATAADARVASGPGAASCSASGRQQQPALFELLSERTSQQGPMPLANTLMGRAAAPVLVPPPAAALEVPRAAGSSKPAPAKRRDRLYYGSSSSGIGGGSRRGSGGSLARPPPPSWQTQERPAKRHGGSSKTSHNDRRPAPARHLLSGVRDALRPGDADDAVAGAIRAAPPREAFAYYDDGGGDMVRDPGHGGRGPRRGGSMGPPHRVPHPRNHCAYISTHLDLPPHPHRHPRQDDAMIGITGAAQHAGELAWEGVGRCGIGPRTLRD